MSAFSEIDWRRLDTWAILAHHGTVTVEPQRLGDCLAWLAANSYRQTLVNFADGIEDAMRALCSSLNWNEQFGYEFAVGLDALRDGFEFSIEAGGGAVLVLSNCDFAWKEDPKWFLGFLSIGQEYTTNQLALGRRFFTVVPLPKSSPIIGAVIEECRVPHIHSD